MTSGSKNSEIYSQFLEHCEPLTAKEPLDFIDLDEDVFAGSSDPVRTVASLGDEYTADELVASGVAVVVPDGAVMPSPALANGGEPLIVLRDAETDEPYELLTDMGCLSASILPCFASLRDRHTRDCLEGGAEGVLTAFSIWDAVVLRAAGLPATLATGLHELPLDEVDQFCDSFSLGRDRSERHRESDTCDDQDETEDQPMDPIRALGLRLAGQTAPAQSASGGNGDENLSGAGGAGAVPIKTRLAFVGWSPAAFGIETPGNLKSIVEHFAKLERFMGVELFDLGLWLPENEEIERLRFFAANRQADLFREAMLDSAYEISSIFGFGKTEEQPKQLGPPTDYPTALARLQAARFDEGKSVPAGPDERKRVWQHCQRLLYEQVVGPLMEDAMATANPIERTLRLGVAEVSHVFHTQTVLLAEKLNRQIAERGIDRVDALPEEQLKNLMAMADRLLNITKGIERWSPPPQTTIIQSEVLNSPTTLHLPHSG